MVLAVEDRLFGLWDDQKLVNIKLKSVLREVGKGLQLSLGDARAGNDMQDDL